MYLDRLASKVTFQNPPKHPSQDCASTARPKSINQKETSLQGEKIMPCYTMLETSGYFSNLFKRDSHTSTTSLPNLGHFWHLRFSNVFSHIPKNHICCGWNHRFSQKIVAWQTDWPSTVQLHSTNRSERIFCEPSSQPIQPNQPRKCPKDYPSSYQLSIWYFKPRYTIGNLLTCSMEPLQTVLACKTSRCFIRNLFNSPSGLKFFRSIRWSQKAWIGWIGYHAVKIHF